MTRLLLLLSLSLLLVPALAGCAPCRSLETAQKAPALQPLSKDASLKIQQATMTTGVIPDIEPRPHLARDHY